MLQPLQTLVFSHVLPATPNATGCYARYNGGRHSRNRTDARLRLVHVSRHRRKGSTPHPGPLLGRGGEGGPNGRRLRFDLGLWTGFRYTGATGVTFRSGGREIRANMPHPLFLLRQSSRQRQSPKSKVEKDHVAPIGGFCVSRLSAMVMSLPGIWHCAPPEIRRFNGRGDTDTNPAITLPLLAQYTFDTQRGS